MSQKQSKIKKCSINNLDIYNILDVHTLLEKVYKKGSIFEFCFERRKLEDKVEFDSMLYKLPKPSCIKVKKYPPSRLIKIYHIKSKKYSDIIVKSTTNTKLFDLLYSYRTGISGYKSNNKIDRYKNLYMVYESLCKNKKYKYIAIRHMLSHPEITNQKVIKTIRRLFKDEKVNIESYKHRKILQQYHEDLMSETKKILLSFIIKKVKRANQVIGHYIII